MNSHTLRPLYPTYNIVVWVGCRWSRRVCPWWCSWALLLGWFPVWSCRHCCSIIVFVFSYCCSINRGKGEFSRGWFITNGRMCWIVAYCVADMHNVICPNRPPAFRVWMDAAFLVRDSINVMVLIWWSFLWNPAVRVSTDGVTFTMIFWMIRYWWCWFSDDPLLQIELNVCAKASVFAVVKPGL